MYCIVVVCYNNDERSPVEYDPLILRAKAFIKKYKFKSYMEAVPKCHEGVFVEVIISKNYYHILYFYIQAVQFIEMNN